MSNDRMLKGNEHIIQQLKLEDENLLAELYREYFLGFVNYFTRYNVSRQDLEEIYQDSVIAFYQNVLNGKLTHLKSSIKTYLYGIGKHKVLDTIRKNKKYRDIEWSEDPIEPINLDPDELTEEQKLLHRHFKNLGDSCQRILKYFYYRGLSIREIVVEGSYKDENTVKSHKSRCLKQLRNLINPGAHE